MSKLMNSCHSLSHRATTMALAALTLAVLAASGVSAQTAGVAFVDDIEQQAMRAARQAKAAPSRQPAAVRAGAPAPSMQSRFPQPTVRSFSRDPKAEEKTGWTTGLKKSLAGLFGGAKDPRQEVQRSRVASASSPTATQPDALAGQAQRRSPGATGALGANGANTAAAHQRQTISQPSLMDRMAATRGNTVEQRPNTGSNQPRGLLQLWSKKSADESATVSNSGRRTPPQVASAQRSRTPAPSAARPEQRESWASKLISPLNRDEQRQTPLTAPKAPQWHRDDQVAMVTDRQSAKAAEPRIQLASPLTTPQAPSTHPLPRVEGPAISTDTQVAPPARTLAESMPAPQAARQPAAKVSQPRRTPGPQQVANVHAMRNAVASTPQPTTRRTSPVANDRTTKPNVGLVATRTGVARQQGMPANPVKRPQPVAAAPTPKSVELLTEANRLSTTAVSEAEYTTVIQLCRHVLAIDEAPTAVEYSHNLASWALNRRGEVKCDEGRTKEALLDFEDSLRLDPNRWRAIHNRGVLAAQVGRFADAFDDFNRSIELNPKFAKAYSNRGALYVQAGKLDKASDDYRQAIALDPELAVAHKGRGRVCHMLGQFDLAVQHFDAATLLVPDDARIVNNRGDLLTDMGRYRGAMSDYAKAIELDTTLHIAYRNLAWLQATCPDQDCRDADQAIANASRAMQLCGEPSDLEYDTLAAAQAAAGDFESAKAMMDKAIDLASDTDKPNYQWRKKLYERGEAYITEPASNIQQVSYAD